VITTGSKFFFGLSAAALVGAIFYGIASNGGEIGMDALLGVTTLGYKGAVGDLYGYSVFMALAGASMFLGCVVVAFRDADARAQATLLELETAPAATAPQGASYWPILAAFGAGTVALGVVIGSQMVFLGAGIIAAATFEWAIKAWSERATGDPEVNRAVRNRMMYPVEIPVLAIVGIATFVLSISRLLIAVPKTGAYLIFGIVPAVILAIGWLITARPTINKNLVAALALVGGVAVLAGGIIGASVGPRTIEEHHEDEGEEHGSLGVLVPGGALQIEASTENQPR
jgi:hypothetical protein